MSQVIKTKTRDTMFGQQYLCADCFASVQLVEKYCWNCGEILRFPKPNDPFIDEDQNSWSLKHKEDK